MKRTLTFILLFVLLGCSTTKEFGRGNAYEDNITVQVHPQNWDSDYVRVYCDQKLVTTIRGLVFNRVETRTIRDISHCNFLSFNVNDVWRSSPLAWSRGIIHVVIEQNMGTSYLYQR